PPPLVSSPPKSPPPPPAPTTRTRISPSLNRLSTPRLLRHSAPRNDSLFWCHCERSEAISARQGIITGRSRSPAGSCRYADSIPSASAPTPRRAAPQTGSSARGGAAADEGEAAQHVDRLAQLLVASRADIAGSDRGLLALGRLRRRARLLGRRGCAVWGTAGGRVRRASLGS